MNPGYAADEKHWCLMNAKLKAFGQKEQLVPCGAESHLQRVMALGPLTVVHVGHLRAQEAVY